MNTQLMTPQAAADDPVEEEDDGPNEEVFAEVIERRRMRVNGEWVERDFMGVQSSGLAAELTILLGIHLGPERPGKIFNSEAAYKMHPGRPIRLPDISYVRFDRLPSDYASTSFLSVPPDLAVEVVSPNDKAEAVETKVMEYLWAGVSLIWVIYPKARCARVLRPGGECRQLTDADDLRGEDVLPGFVCNLGGLLDRK